MTLEAELVVILSRNPLLESGEVRASDLINRGLEWSAVFAWAKAFEVEPVFYQNLLQLGAGNVPGGVLEDAAAREQAARADVIGACLRVSDVAARLEEQGVRTIVLKGPATGFFAYGDPTLRSFGDSDFLVRTENVQDAREVLLAAGFTRNYAPSDERQLIKGGHALEFSRGASYVEVHCELLERHLSFDVSSDSLWEEAERIRIPGGEIWSLDEARLFLFLCAHGTKHAWSRFRWICDLAQFADRLSPASAKTVVELARMNNGARILGVALSLVREVYGSTPDLFDGYVVDSTAKELARTCTAKLGLAAEIGPQGWQQTLDDDTRALLFWARSRERKRDAMRSIVRVALVPTSKDWPGGPLSWVTRPVRLSGRLASRVIRGSWAR
jgi:hypothetical protein